MIERSVSIVGLGVIGGSLARALAANGVDVRAWSDSADDRAAAVAAGVAVIQDVDEPLVELARGAALVALAVPVQEVAAVAARMLSVISSACVVLHTGSLQQQRSIGVDDACWERLLGTHPVTGSEGAGFRASRADLFRGAAVSVEARAPARSRQLAEELWTAAGVQRIDVRSAAEHDTLMVWMSHLPQLTATALAATLSAAGVAPWDGGPGARDTTRLASSPIALWSALLAAARPEVVCAVLDLERTLARLRVAIESGDDDFLRQEWEPARRWRGAMEASP